MMRPLDFVLQVLAIVDSQPWEKPTAQKQYGVYRPVVVHPTGRREFCANVATTERIQPLTQFYSGPTEMIRYKRGRCYADRASAIADAERVVAARKQTMVDRLLEPRYRRLREHFGLPREVPV